MITTERRRKSTKLKQQGVDWQGKMDTDFHLMEQSSPASQSEFAQEPPNSTPKARVGASTNDQRFLLVFILGSYFGPDLRDEVPHKSALQRAVMGLPPYTAEQLVASVFKLSEIESIYYYALRYNCVWRLMCMAILQTNSYFPCVTFFKCRIFQACVM